MAIPTSNIANSTTPSSAPSGNTSNANARTDESKGASAPPSAAQAMAQSKVQLNTQIVQASLTVSIGAGNEPQQLVLRSVVEKLNELLADGTGVPALQTASQQDNSPEGTAGRIVAMATGMYEAFAKKHPSDNEDDTLSAFMDTIRSGVEQGFKEARGILEGLSALQGDVAGNIDKTYDLVMKGLDDFLTNFKPKGAPEAGAQEGTADQAAKPAQTAKA